MLKEASIIELLKTEFPEKIGDDAAVFPYTKKQAYLISKDLLIQDIHFKPSYSDPASLAVKALHVNLSDIAAMGGTPTMALLGLAVPTSYEKQLPDFLQAFSKTCKDCGVMLIGGDTTKSPEYLIISVTVIGLGEYTQLKYRHTATIHDKIYVAGKLGFAHLGLQAFETSEAALTTFQTSFLKPTARLKEGVWLGQQPGVHAMMDISDGLHIDLTRLSEASKVAAEIHLDQLPVDEEFILACQQLKLDPLITQLTGGEDYGLLVSIDAAQAADISAQFLVTFGYPLTPIGLTKKGQGVSLIKNGLKTPLNLKPFSHFGEL